MSLLHWSYATLQLTICSPSSYSPLLLRIYPVSTCFQTQFSGAYSASRALYPYVFSCSLPTTISPSLSSSQCAPTSNFPHLLLHPITCTHLGVCLLLSLSLSPVEGHLHALELSQVPLRPRQLPRRPSKPSVGPSQYPLIPSEPSKTS